MPPTTPRTARHTFATGGPPRPGTFAPTGPPRRVTSRSLNDVVIRTTVPPRALPRTLAATAFFGRLQHAGLPFLTAFHDFTLGVLDGLEDSLKSAWKLLSSDLWHARTYTELGTTLLALNMLDAFNIPGSMARAQAFDNFWGTHVAQRQLAIMMAIAQLVQDVPRWTPRQWGHAVGRLVGDIVLAKGAGAAVKATMGVAAAATAVGVRVAASESVQLSTIATQLQTLGRISAGTSKLAKARAILPVYARFTLVRTAIPFLDVRAAVNKTTFWSGLEKLTPTSEAFEHAEMLARASNRTTLEMTKGGAWLGRQSKLLGNGTASYVDWVSQLRPQWGRLSARFAQQARGTVDMYKGPYYAGPKSVWEEFERAPLQEALHKGQVTDIRTINVPKK